MFFFTFKRMILIIFYVANSRLSCDTTVLTSDCFLFLKVVSAVDVQEEPMFVSITNFASNKFTSVRMKILLTVSNSREIRLGLCNAACIELISRNISSYGNILKIFEWYFPIYTTRGLGEGIFSTTVHNFALIQ